MGSPIAAFEDFLTKAIMDTITEAYLEHGKVSYPGIRRFDNYLMNAGKRYKDRSDPYIVDKFDKFVHHGKSHVFSIMSIVADRCYRKIIPEISAGNIDELRNEIMFLTVMFMSNMDKEGMVKCMGPDENGSTVDEMIEKVSKYKSVR